MTVRKIRLAEKELTARKIKLFEEKSSYRTGKIPVNDGYFYSKKKY